MDDMPPNVTGELRDRIRAELLRINADIFQSSTAPKLKPKPDECLEAACDIYVKELLRAGWPLTSALLADIPMWVFQWAWVHRWPPTKRTIAKTEPRRNFRGHYFTVCTGYVEQPIPEADYRASVWEKMRGRIAYWQAEELARAIQERATPTRDASTLGMLKTLIERHGIDKTLRLLNELLGPDDGVTRSTLLAWRALEEGKPVSKPPKPEKRAKIAEAIRRLASAD
jgi:hypothetical protein